MINIGLLGLGTVGTGIIEILNQNNEKFKKATKEEIMVKKALVKNKNKKRDVNLQPNQIVTDFNEILQDNDISIIVEVTSDISLSYEYIKKALTAGKHVVTANKAIVSLYFEELSALAEENNVAFLYEASVGGGIPIIKPLKDQLMINKINKIQGILNGTCNYILTKMINEGKDYDEVLKDAQELGYAEADPTADVEGGDTLRKLRILGTLALQGKISEEDILLSGISNIQACDIENIKNMNSTIKLIGEVNLEENGYTAIVQPTIVKRNNYFANVNMAYNSIAFKGDNVGELKFYGPGAGKLPTANAVLNDVLDIAMDNYSKKNPLGDNALTNVNIQIKDHYYLRVSNTNVEGQELLKEIAKEVLMVGNITSIITEEIKLDTIKDKLSSLNIQGGYFLARILD